LKKRTKKLLLNWGMGGFTSTTQVYKVFLLAGRAVPFLFTKKKCFLTSFPPLLLLPPRRNADTLRRTIWEPAFYGYVW
jgi:hypothetical protein